MMHYKTTQSNFYHRPPAWWFNFVIL